MSTFKIDRDNNDTRVNVFCPLGFHGDPHLLRIVDILAGKVNQFIETGTEAGSTVGYFARMYPHVQCSTAEMDRVTHETASKNLANHDNIILFNQHSLDFLKAFLDQRGSINTGPVLFWLDAHSHGWGCDLGEEVGIILDRWDSGYILLDDFQVPDHPEFKFDNYESYGPLNMDNIAKELTQEQQDKIALVIYPSYKPTWPARGWALIIFGDVEVVDFNVTSQVLFESNSLDAGNYANT